MNKSILTSWKHYYILDSLSINPQNIPTYPGLTYFEINELIELVKVNNYVDDKNNLTTFGQTRLKELYRELGLNRYNKHIYPNFKDIFTN